MRTCGTLIGGPGWRVLGRRGLAAIREYRRENSVWFDTAGEVANPFVRR